MAENVHHIVDYKRKCKTCEGGGETFDGWYPETCIDCRGTGWARHVRHHNIIVRLQRRELMVLVEASIVDASTYGE